MEEKGISQADICRELDVSSATVSDWCTGKKYPRIDAMQRLAELLGVRVSTLITEGGIQDYEDLQMVEALHQNPKLRMLFSLQQKMSESNLDAVTAVVKAIARERGDDD
jgi:transcriptional regulator with XRE-family HTH domain